MEVVPDLSRDGSAACVTFGAGCSVGVLEIQVVRRRNGPIFRHRVEVRNLVHVEPLIDGAVHGSVAELTALHFRQLAGAVCPRDAKELWNSAEAGFHLVVLDARDVPARKHPFEARVRPAPEVFDCCGE